MTSFGVTTIEAGQTISMIAPGGRVSSDGVSRSVLRRRLASMSFDETGAVGTSEQLLGWVAGTLSSVDYNFRILSQSGGDLQAYILLQVSHRLYHRLWED